MKYSQKPVARKKELVIQEAPDEVLIYDPETNKGFCLNPITAFVWKNCNGQNSVDDIVRRFETETGGTVSSREISFAVDQLNEKNLLEPNMRSKLTGETRRSALKKIGFASMVAVPVIASMAAEAKSFEYAADMRRESAAYDPTGMDSPQVTYSAPPSLLVPCSDRLTPLQAGKNVMSFMVPAIGNPLFYAYLTTAAASGQFTIDLKRNDISILSTKITIDAGQKTSVTAAAPSVAAIDNLVLGDEIVVDITDAADGSATGLMVLITSRGAVDQVAPTIPAGLTLTAKSPTQMTAQWAPAATN